MPQRRRSTVPGTCDLRPEIDAAFEALRMELTRLGDSGAADEADAHALAVHGARRAIKRLRALLRLLADDTVRLDRTLRDLARRLSPARDQHVAARTAARLATRIRDARVAALLRDIARDQDAVAAAREARSHAVPRLAALGIGMAALSTTASPADLAGTLARRLKRARARLARAMADGEAEALHDARTLIVRLQLQLVALRRMGGLPAGRRAKRLDRLRDILGDHHDLHVLGDLIERSPGADPEVKASTRETLRRAMRRLERSAEAVAAKAFDVSPRALRKRLGRRLAAAAA